MRGVGVVNLAVVAGTCELGAISDSDNLDGSQFAEETVKAGIAMLKCKDVSSVSYVRYLHRLDHTYLIR